MAPKNKFLYKETFPSAQLGLLSEHFSLRALLALTGAQGFGAGVLAVSKAIPLILLRAGWGRAVLPHMAIGISQVILLCEGLSFWGCLGLSTGLAAGIPGPGPALQP